MTHVSESIDVAVGADRVFPLFTDLETLPRMLSFIRSVEQLDAERTRWVVAIAGQERTFNVRLVEHEPGRRLVWERDAASAQPFRIQALTEPLGPESTRVTIDAEFDAGGMAEKLGLAKALASKGLRDELKNSKLYVERRYAG